MRGLDIVFGHDNTNELAALKRLIAATI